MRTGVAVLVMLLTGCATSPPESSRSERRPAASANAAIADRTTPEEWREFAPFQGADLRKLEDATRKKVEALLEVILPGWKAPSNATSD